MIGPAMRPGHRLVTRGLIFSILTHSQPQDLMDDFEDDIAAVRSIKAIPTILDIVCRTTGMRFAAVARVTEDRWIACNVRDDIAFGLAPGGELKVETTICHEIRQSGEAVVIDHVGADPAFCNHATPAMYGFQSYISMPIRLTDGSFFGTLCAIDPEPHALNTPDTIKMFEMFADVIGFHLSAIDRLTLTEARLFDERKNAALREQFIAVLSHDLRNPLAAISAGMHVLRRRPLDEKSTTVVGMVLNSVARMAGLIDDVTDFARVRLGGGLVLTRNTGEPVEPALSQVVAEFRTSAPERLIQARFAITEPVDCDHRRIAQLASNLLGNALTHGTPGKPVEIAATTTGDWFRLSVTNAGDPIPPEVLKTLFQPFTRGVLSPAKNGLGLGLYIAHQIAVAHGGTLHVVSVPAGTRFTFRMPLQP
jgi:signal transduction histidine kinase